MYCNNCGKEVNQNVKFCTHCGAKLEVISMGETNNKVDVSTGKIGIFRSIGFIPVILLIILGIMFLSTAISRYSGNADAFEWTDDSARVIGIILHWGIMCIFLATCVECIIKFLGQGMKGEILITNGILIFAYAFALQVGHWIFNDWSFEDMSIIMYRIFGTYNGLIGISIFFAIIIFAIGILLIKINNAQLQS